VAARQHVKLDVRGALPQPLRKGFGDGGRIIVVAAPGDMQDGRADWLSGSRFPIARQPAADPKNAANFRRRGGGETIIQRYRLREACQNPAPRRNSEFRSHFI